jgi:hypothetical protein
MNKKIIIKNWIGGMLLVAATSIINEVDFNFIIKCLMALSGWIVLFSFNNKLYERKND